MAQPSGSLLSAALTLLTGALLAALLLLPPRASAQPQGGAGWRKGRATYFSGPDYFTSAFDAARGVGSFGILEKGSCGFTNSDGSLPFTRDSVAAAADANPDYGGSCNRCYAVRCRSGLILDNNGVPLNWQRANDTYLPSVSRTLPDTYGRAWPGNDAEAQGLSDTKCWDESKELTVRIIDTCPCVQVLQAGAPGVKPGGEVRRQPECCGGSAGIAKFDLSFWAFEKLAHPLYGQMMLEYRPVDCDSGQTVPADFVDKNMIYKGTGSGGTGAGWGWFVYRGSQSYYAVNGAGPAGEVATCVELAAKGGITFEVKRGASLQPFAGAKSLQFDLRPGAPPPAPAGADAPLLKLFVLNDETQSFCNAEALTSDLANGSSPLPGGWRRYTLPFASLRCDYKGALPEEVDRVDFQNPATDISVAFCLTNFAILR